MLWRSKKWLEFLSDTLELTRSLAKAADLAELARGLGTSRRVRELSDGLALWHFGPEGSEGVRAPGTDRSVLTAEPGRLFPTEGPVDPVEVYDRSFGPYAFACFHPLVRGRMVLGALGLFTRSKDGLDAAGKALGSLLAAQLSVLLENLSLRRTLQVRTEAFSNRPDYLEEVVRSINSGILVIRQDGEILVANPCAAATLGVEVEDVVGRDADEVLPGIKGLLEGDSRESMFELSGRRALHLGFSTSAFALADVTGTIVLFRDLGEILEMRRQLRNREYFAAVGETASWIAHEVRTPLFAISSIAKLLSSQVGDNDLRTLSGSILTETERLGRLVEGILQYGRPEELHLTDCLLGDLLSATRERLTPVVTDAGGAIEVRTDDDLPCRLDRDKVTQVFHNIVKNALEAGAKRVLVEARRVRDQVEIRFRDDGRGIREENLPKVFRPFFTTRKAGTGLGLAICKKIIEQHGGAIAIRSEPEAGTEVTVTLRPCG
ncbi:MAG: ATP-binding protein [Deltaproteobacteria bacterium]|nr:ATP-binding protein [Deltaproteobacteria bacterium]